MPKFFAQSDKITENQIIIDTEDVNHITRVLRLSEGDVVIVCDSRGVDYDARITAIEPRRVLCAIEGRRKSDAEPELKATLFQALPKASKMEYIIQKTTELGVSEIVPVRLARCVAKIDGAKEEQKKLDRWKKIAEAAAKQSGRGIIPKISPVMSLEEVIERAMTFNLFFAPYECEEQNTLRSVLLSKPNVRTVGFIIGPEGGFDAAETDRLRTAGIPTVTLGRRILRTETAGEAALAMIMYEIGDVNK